MTDDLCLECGGLGWVFYGRDEDPPEGPCRECQLPTTQDSNHSTY